MGYEQTNPTRTRVQARRAQHALVNSSRSEESWAEYEADETGVRRERRERGHDSPRNHCSAARTASATLRASTTGATKVAVPFAATGQRNVGHCAGHQS